jgi:hypothetical protein
MQLFRQPYGLDPVSSPFSKRGGGFAVSAMYRFAFPNEPVLAVWLLFAAMS